MRFLGDDDPSDVESLGDERYDDFPHGGGWTRPDPDDRLGVRCDAHGLRPDEHSGHLG